MPVDKLFTPKTIEFAVPGATEKSVPLAGGEPENRTLRIPAVPDADPPVRQVGHLHTVAVSETERALDPAEARGLPVRHVFAHGSSVTIALIVD
jgi:hypothetical protein